MDWPRWIDSKPKGFRAALDKLVADTKELLSKRDSYRAEYGNSRASSDAKKLSAAASQLLSDVRRYHNKVFMAEADNLKVSALKHLSEQLEPDDIEKGLIQSAFSPYSLQWVLLGLSTHMNVISNSINTKGGQNPMLIEQWATDRLLALSDQAGISMKRSDSRNMQDLFAALFTKAGFNKLPSERFFTNRKKAFKQKLDN
jgi:hypothetical protein